jgi:hypothetical protein
LSVHTFAGEQAYVANAKSIGLRWRAYLGLAAVPLVLVAVAFATPSFPFKDLCVGFAVGGVVMTLALSAANFDSRPMCGHLAETFSLESLRKVSGWTVIENLPFDGVDVDHVVITPSGVLAVETKYFGPLIRGSQAERDRVAQARESATAAARKVHLFLRSEKLHEAVKITPVLMVWGPGAPRFTETHRVLADGVHVVQAEHPQLWSHLFQAPLVSVATRERVSQALDRYVAKKLARDAERVPALRGRMWAEFRAGMSAERTARALRKVQADQLRRRHQRRRRQADRPPQGEELVA